MLYILIILGIVGRLLPHPPNFAPVMALGLFAGCYLGWGRGMIVALAAMLISNAIIGFYSWPIMLSVYGSMAAGGLIGGWVARNKSLKRVMSGALAASLLFYLVTNFAVWAAGTMYPKTFEGLIACYVAAIPFFKNSLLADLSYTAVFFGSYELAGPAVNLWLRQKFNLSKEVRI